MNRSAYKFNIEASLVIGGETTNLNPNYIKYIVIELLQKLVV